MEQPDNLNLLFSNPIEIQAQLEGGLFLLPIRVNGSPAPLYFLLDTGAEISIIQREAAKALRLKGDDQLSLNGAGGDTETNGSIVNNMTLESGGLTVSNARLAVAHINLQFKHHCSGILGFDILKRAVIKLDYQNKTVVFINPATFTDNQQIRIPFQVSNGAAMMQVSLSSNGGFFTTPIQLDTGSFGGIQLSPQFIEENPSFRMTVLAKNRANGLGGSAGFSIGMSPEIKLGDYVMHDQPVELLSQCPGEGLLGAQILSQFKVTLDGPDSALLLRPVAESAPTNPAVIAAVMPVAPPPAPAPEQQKSLSPGVDVSITPNGYTVLSVEPGSQAQRAGLHKGDIIVQLDQRDLGVMDIEEFKRLLCFPIKRFGIYRDGDFQQMRVRDE